MNETHKITKAEVVSVSPAITKAKVVSVSPAMFGVRYTFDDGTDDVVGRAPKSKRSGTRRPRRGGVASRTLTAVCCSPSKIWTRPSR